MIKRAKYRNHQEALKHLNQAQWPQSQFIKLKETMMTNGPLSLNLILSCSKRKKSSKEWESKSLRKKSKKSLINKCKKKGEKKKDRIKNWKNIISFNKNKPGFMMKDKEKRKKSIKERLNLRKKCVIDKWKMSLKERNFKRRRKINLTIFLSKKSKKKFLSNNRKWEIENWKNSKGLNKLWRKMRKMKEDSDKKLKDKELK